MSGVSFVFNRSDWPKLAEYHTDLVERYTKPKMIDKLFSQLHYIEAQIKHPDSAGRKETDLIHRDIVVLGPRILDHQDIIDNFGLFTTPESQLSKKNRILASSSRNGALLGVTPWTPLMNDVFIMSCVEKKKEFHISREGLFSLSDQELWHTTQGSMTVFARELVLILSAGYGVMPGAHGCGFTLAPLKKSLCNDSNCETRAPGLKLYTDCLGVIKKITTLKHLREYLEPFFKNPV